MNQTPFKKATLIALSTACISGVSIFLNKFAVTSVNDPILFSGIKNMLVALFLVGAMFAFSKRQEVYTITKKQWKQLITLGLLGGAIPFALFYTGLSMIPAINGAIIHKTLFIWVALLATIFLREKLSFLQWLGFSLLFASNVIIGGFIQFTGSTGELLVLGATLFWAVEFLLAKKLLKELSILTVASGRMVFGSLFLGIFLAMTGRLSNLATMTPSNALWIGLTVFLLLAYVTTWYSALKYAPASYVAALLVPSTVITNILTAIFITGTFTKTHILSTLLVILGSTCVIFFMNFSIRNKTSKMLVAG